jgi:hypothetical protein
MNQWRNTMSTPSLATMFPEHAVSPLMLADQLLTLAQDAERSGLHRPAERLLKLAYALYGEKPLQA